MSRVLCKTLIKSWDLELASRDPHERSICIVILSLIIFDFNERVVDLVVDKSAPC
jgi:hypothetical protein